MMERLVQGLGHDKLWVRVGYAMLCFCILLALAYLFGMVLLPTGFMKTLPFPPLALFEEKQSFSSLFARTVAYNLFALLLIVGANHFRVRRFTFGYLPLYANTVLLGLFAGEVHHTRCLRCYTLNTGADELAETVLNNLLPRQRTNARNLYL